MNGQSRRTGSVMIGIACVLFSLVLISIAMMSGLYAKYMSRDDGDDGARVAKFDVKAGMDKNDVSVNLSEGTVRGDYVITVRNDSEVAVEYDIIVSVVLPAGVGVKIGDVTPVKNGNAYMFSTDEWVLSTNGNEATHTLTFFVDDQDAFTAGATGESCSASFDFDVTCSFVQID